MLVVTEMISQETAVMVLKILLGVKLRRSSFSSQLAPLRNLLSHFSFGMGFPVSISGTAHLGLAAHLERLLQALSIFTASLLPPSNVLSQSNRFSEFFSGDWKMEKILLA